MTVVSRAKARRSSGKSNPISNPSLGSMARLQTSVQGRNTIRSTEATTTTTAAAAAPLTYVEIFCKRTDMNPSGIHEKMYYKVEGGVWTLLNPAGVDMRPAFGAPVGNYDMANHVPYPGTMTLEDFEAEVRNGLGLAANAVLVPINNTASSLVYWNNGLGQTEVSNQGGWLSIKTYQ